MLICRQCGLKVPLGTMSEHYLDKHLDAKTDTLKISELEAEILGIEIIKDEDKDDQSRR